MPGSATLDRMIGDTVEHLFFAFSSRPLIPSRLMSDSKSDSSHGQSQEEQVSARSNRLARMQWHFLTLVLALVSLSPLLYFRVGDIWRNPDHRLLLIVWPVVFGSIFYCLARGQNACGLGRSRGLSAVFLYGLGAIVSLVSIWYFEPSLANLAICFVVTAWGLVAFNEWHWSVPCAFGLLLSVTLGMPFGAFFDCEMFVRGVAVWLASTILDGLSIPNLVSGNVFQIEELSVRIDNVMGGFSSVFAMTAIAVLLLALKRRSFATAMVGVLTIPFWCSLIYAFRLLTITAVHISSGRDLSTGNDALLLIAGTLLLGVILIYLTLKILGLVFQQVEFENENVPPFFNLMNQIIAWPTTKSAFEARESEGQASVPSGNWTWSSEAGTKWGTLAASCTILVSGAASLFLLSKGELHSQFFANNPTSEEGFKAALASNMPSSVGQWSLSESNDEFGLEYQANGQTLLLDVQGPMIGWELPQEVWIRSGWAINVAGTEEASNWKFFIAELETDLGGKAYVLESAVLPDLTSGDLVSEDSKRVNFFGLLNGDNHKSYTENFRIRAFTESGRRLTRKELAELVESYDEMRHRLLAKQVPKKPEA